jgi:hypothetical protein
MAGPASAADALPATPDGAWAACPVAAEVAGDGAWPLLQAAPSSTTDAMTAMILESTMFTLP